MFEIKTSFKGHVLDTQVYLLELVGVSTLCLKCYFFEEMRHETDLSHCTKEIDNDDMVTVVLVHNY